VYCSGTASVLAARNTPPASFVENPERQELVPFGNYHQCFWRISNQQFGSNVNANLCVTCKNFRAIVEKARMQYQRLFQIAATAAEANPALSWSGSRAGTPFQPATAVGHSEFMPPSPLRVIVTASQNWWQKKPRGTTGIKSAWMPTGLHLYQILEKYGLTVNIHVLIGEYKHRLFKMLVYNTNHSNNVERQLLLPENF
jgi:hypothetical protein